MSARRGITSTPFILTETAVATKRLFVFVCAVMRRTLVAKIVQEKTNARECAAVHPRTGKLLCARNRAAPRTRTSAPRMSPERWLYVVRDDTVV
jgi:hypothetical protein